MAKYELTGEQLQEIITSAVKAAVQPAAATMTEDAKLHDLTEQLKGHTRPVPRERLVACKSDETGATFRLRVVESRSTPLGRIVDLIDYAHPDGVDRHVSDGGRVPDGFTIRRKDNGEPVLEYKQWLWENYWRADLRYYVGRPMSLRYRADPDAPEEPWTTPQRPAEVSQ